MKKFAMKCTCGDEMTVDADNLDEAKMKMKEMMIEDTIKKHMQERHQQNDPVPTVEQAHMMIDQTMHEVTAQAA